MKVQLGMKGLNLAYPLINPLKMYKHRAETRVEDIQGRLRDQDQQHSSRLTQYERELRHLGHLVKEKQDALDSAVADKQWVFSLSRSNHNVIKATR